MQYYAVQYCAVQYCAVQYCAVQYCAVQYCQGSPAWLHGSPAPLPSPPVQGVLGGVYKAELGGEHLLPVVLLLGGRQAPAAVHLEDRCRQCPVSDTVSGGEDDQEDDIPRDDLGVRVIRHPHWLGGV